MSSGGTTARPLRGKRQHFQEERRGTAPALREFEDLELAGKDIAPIKALHPVGETRSTISS
jgi:hypothetical protein